MDENETISNSPREDTSGASKDYSASEKLEIQDKSEKNNSESENRSEMDSEAINDVGSGDAELQNHVDRETESYVQPMNVDVSESNDNGKCPFYSKAILCTKFFFMYYVNLCICRRII